jgi:hypothetical protein
MTMTLPASSPADCSPLVKTLLVIGAVVGMLEGLFGFATSITSDPLLGILHPILGLGAVGFALAGGLRPGITALALLALSLWARLIGMFDLTGDVFLITAAILKVYVQPALAVGAIAAAWFSRRPFAATAAATVAVMLPPIVDWAGVVVLIIHVSIYGF